MIDAERELKTLGEIGRHFPRREPGARGNAVGVGRSTVLAHIRAGRLKLEEIEFKGHRYYRVPLEDQTADPATWRLGRKYTARKRGRPTNAERIGL